MVTLINIMQMRRLFRQTGFRCKVRFRIFNFITLMRHSFSESMIELLGPNRCQDEKMVLGI